MHSWFRSWHGAPADPKWRVIARRADVRLAEVIGVAWYLLDVASQADDRGSIAEQDVETIGAATDLEPETVGRIIQAMHERNILTGNRFTAWEDRQPSREDDSRERVSRHRGKINNPAVTQRNAETAIVTQCNAATETVTQRNAEDTDVTQKREAVTRCNATATVVTHCNASDTDKTKSKKKSIDSSLRSESRPTAPPSDSTSTPSARSRGKPDAELRAAFERFWPLYPRRVQRSRALEVWLRQIRIEIVPDVCQAAIQYAELRRGEEERYTLYASTWLAKGRWRDSLTDKRPAGSSDVGGVGAEPERLKRAPPTPEQLAYHDEQRRWRRNLYDKQLERMRKEQHYIRTGEILE